LDESQTERLTQMNEYFKFFDVDSSGRLDLEEFGKMCKAMVEGGYDLKQIGFNSDLLDHDHDGFVNFNEYVSHMISLGVLDDSKGARPINF